MAGIGKLAKLVQTAEKGLKATRKNAGKLVQTIDKNGPKVEIYEKQVGKYNPFRRTKKVTTRFVEGEETATRVTVQRQKGSLFQTHTSYADGRSASSVVDVKKGQQIYQGPNGSFTKQTREGLAKKHPADNFTRNWVIGGTTGTIAVGTAAYALTGNDDEEVAPITTETPENPETAATPEDSTATAPADSTATAPTVPAVPAAPVDSTATAPTDSIATTPIAPVAPAAPVDSTATAPTDSIATTPVAPVAPAAPADSTATAPVQPAAPEAPAASAPAQQTPPNNNLFGGSLNEISIKEYNVVKGDCLWNIAKHELQKANPGKTITNGHILAQVKEFIRLNPQIKNPDLIYPDQKIKTAA